MRKIKFTPHLLRGKRKSPSISNGKGAGFINCKIDISRKVFYPRIETEFWVKKAIKEIRKIKKPMEILDVFAGTGCIGISILKAVKNATACFIDIDRGAIEQIKINLRLNKISKKRYKIYQSNLFEKLAPYRTCSPASLREAGRAGAGIKNNKYNFIFANSPYVALDRIYEVQKEVLEREPHTALFAGKNGMDYIKKFLSQVKKHLKPNGKIFLEFDPFQKEEIKGILEKKDFKFVFGKDQFRKYRWLKAEIE